MVRINLSTDDIFEKNNQMMKIVTSGIDTTDRFEENPIMLFEHNPEKILGRWTSVERDEHVLSAVPDFDEDEFSVNIGNKVKKGSVKSASVGIEIKDAYMEGDVLVISKSTLLEASLVGIPANKQAKVQDFSKGTILFFSNDGKELDIEDYTKKLKDMENPKIENLEEIKVDEVVEDVETVDNELETLNASLIEKNATIENLTATKIELGLTITNLNKSVEDLTKEKETLNASLVEKDKEIENLNNAIIEMKKEKIDILLNSAIEEGKITREAKEDFAELSYEKAKSILDKLIPSEVSLMDTIRASKRDVEKNYEWYQKNDKEGLRKLSKENPTLYKQLESAYANKLK